MPTGPRKAGEFCWINVLTPDPAAAQGFFSSLFGWTYLEIPGMGHRIQVDGHDIGGMWDHASPNTPPGVPPGIGVMVRVDSADAMASRVTELGGTAKPAFDIMEQGRMAECHDPNGANFDLWQPNASPGMTADGTRHGAPSWFELMASDRDKAVKFYQALFGWAATTMPMPGFDYTVMKLGDSMVAGMMQITPDMGNFPSHWGVYCTVDDVDATARRVEELGGTITMPLMDIPDTGRMVGFTSPQGVMLYAITYSN
ncbi:MAG TPA: VOC family protein [Gemmatimonadales bacterium]|nr:VOC family protein [Gemmatimonadales bacterium]